MLHLFLKGAPGFRSIKYHFCFRFFATMANQQHYKTSPYDMGWRFGGSVGIEQFWWRIFDKNNIHQFTVSIYAKFRETVMWHGLGTMCDQSPSTLCLGDPVAWYRHVVIGWTLARSTGAVQSCLYSLSHIHVTLFLQHLLRACSEQSRSTSLLPINHVIQMPQCL